MIIIFPMGGTGDRFKKAGYKSPKPLIRLNNVPLFDSVKCCYPIENVGMRHIYIIRPELEPDFPLGSVVLYKNTKGPLETILEGSVPVIRDLLKEDQELLIADCDSLIDKEELMDCLFYFRDCGADGGVTVMRSENPNYSYASVDNNGFVKETREKDPFTFITTTGPYWFKSTLDFVKYGRQAIKDGVVSISPVYNYLIKDGKKVKAEKTDTFIHLGSPEELEKHAIDHCFTLSK